MKLKLFTIILLSILSFNAYAEGVSAVQYQINWTGIDNWQTEKTEKKVLSFVGAQYPSENYLPYFVKTIDCETNTVYRVSIANAVFVAADAREETLISEIELPGEITVQTEKVVQRGNESLNIQILPFIRKDGKVQKLVNFELVISPQKQAEKAPSKTLHSYAASSVLASGKFKKIKITDSGIYKITYETLNSMGIKPADVRIFGYGGALLEQNFLLPKPDDLPEVAIWMEKGADGVFNAGDYILFYAQGVVKWNYDAAKNIFTHTLNMYSNEGYYFVTSDAGTGKKIQDKTITLPDGTAAVNVTEFVDYQLHEKESQNLAKTGKVFYGETFGDVVSYNFPFSFPNAVNTATTKARLDVAAISTENSSFTLKLNDTQAQSLTVLKKVSDNYEIGKDANAVFTFTPSSDNYVFNLLYTKSTSISKGYLNYLEVNARRKLMMTGNVMFFRNTDNAYSANYNHFQISGVNSNVQIWDITDQSNIRRIITTRTGNILDFYDSNDVIKEYVAIDPTSASSFSQPTIVGDVPNQNLHEMGTTEMVIITHPTFLAQAEKLAEAHREKDNMNVSVVTTEQVYNEFSSGTPDATAYRWVMKMLYDRALASGNTNNLPKYLLLFGRGSYDNRGIILNSGDNLILTYQTEMSLDIVKSYVTDDYFGFLDDNEGNQIPSHLLDIGIGRFPVSTETQATNVVNKTISYMNNTQKGDWKNQLCFVADDGDGALHMRQADSIAQTVFRSNPGYQYDKIYLDAYKQEKSASGDSYPLARTKLHNLIQSGVFMLNFTGHASALGWTDEQILTTADIKEMYNSNLPVWMAATCDFLLFDVKDISAGEYVLLNPSGGGVALFSAARTVYASQNEKLNRNFSVNLFQKTDGKYNRLGDVVAKAKNLTGTEVNKLSYILLGDPAVMLNYPTEYNVVTEKINNKLVQPTDTLKALSVDSVQGYISDINGTKVTDFNGTLEITIYDKAQRITTLNNHNDGTLTYTDRPNVLYAGKANVKNGEFSFTFMIPKDIRYNFGTGRISYYASDATQEKEAQGYYENFIVGGSSTSYQHETEGPVVKMYLNNENFVSGGKVNETPLFAANISDINGINTVGSGIGHDLRLIIDENSATSYTLNDYFVAETNSYTSGSVKFKLPELAEGKHTLSFHAWDLLNNSSVNTLDFVVVKGLTPKIYSVSNYPNPVTNQTRFVVQHDRPETILQTSVEIFDLTGRKIWSKSQSSVENLTWNRTDATGKRVSAGIYIYRISIKTADSEMTSKSNKIIAIGQ